MVTLYGTSACHLCEIAEEMLQCAGVEFRKIDIADSDALFERYGLIIPVLQRGDGLELNWPFSEEALAEFLR
jgi:hypothetical protein